MKNKKPLFLALTLCLFFFLLSCEKESLSITKSEIVDTPVNSEIATTTPISATPSGQIEVICGMLSFPTMSDYQATLEGLEEQANLFDDAFVTANDDLDEDALDDFEEATGFNSEQPLDDFESQYDYTSLRTVFNAAEALWLDNDVLDEDNDPNDHFIIDTYLQTLLNSEEEVMIAGSIYKFLESGAYYEITDGDCATLAGIKSGAIDPFAAPNVIVHHPENIGTRSPDECRTNKKKQGYKYNSSNNRRIKWKVKVYNYPWQCGAKAKTKGYKKRRGKWKNRRTKIQACIKGFFCNENGVIDTSLGLKDKDKACSKVKKRKSISVKMTGPCKTKSGEIKGEHAGHGIIYFSTLTF